MKKNSEEVYQLNLFEFGNDSEGNYINLSEKEEEDYNFTFTYEEIIAEDKNNNDFCIVAWHSYSPLWQDHRTLEEIRKDIREVAKTKCYHYGNMAKDIYAYSFKEDDDFYWFCIENPKHIVVVKHTSDINNILTGKETICYPACCVYLFEKTENGLKKIDSGWGEYKQDIRYKIICDEFKILEFSTNRIYPDKKPKDFYEAEYKLSDFINYWGDK